VFVYSVIVGYCWYCIFNRAGSSINVAISILFGGENISFDASLVVYINNTNIPPIMIIIRMYENQNILYMYCSSDETYCCCLCVCVCVYK